jgi:hypothetical protein
MARTADLPVPVDKIKPVRIGQEHNTVEGPRGCQAGIVLI